MSLLTELEAPAVAEGLFGPGFAASGGFDEVMASPSQPRPYWQELVGSLERLGRHELASRWESGRRIIREHGVTYNVHGDPNGTDRPWGLDLVPLLVAGPDWRRLEAGLLQRSQLFNQILTDCYLGGQRLLRDGFLPPELVYANPGFLRPCRGIPAMKNVFVHLQACDVARSGDGGWWALSDRTQAPSGAGYALENRAVISRVLPEEIRGSEVRRLADFFRAEREMLRGLAPSGRDNPGVVLLSAGPRDDTYFEHAYLARHLGVPLVEGADLTVRDRRVFLKTLEGLQPVDVILRLVDDVLCDPLELRGDSFQGVAGLVESTRAGFVTLANALGSALMETPAMLAFLPGLSRHLLGEELKLPSVPTWWCGEAAGLRYVLEHLDQLVIKPAFGVAGRQPWFGGRLTSPEQGRLRAMIEANPGGYVGQERIVLSRAPVWTDHGLESRAVVLRTFVANGGDVQQVLPGGLTRVSRTAEDPVVSMQSSGGSKDTWVLGDLTELSTEALVGHNDSRPGEHVLSGVPSRAADNLFWLGRYTERLEQTLRILRCALGRLTDEGTHEGSIALAALGGLLKQLEMLPAAMSSDSGAEEIQPHVLQLVYKPGLAGGVRDLLARIRSLASTVRDRFSADTWRIFDRLEADSQARPGHLPAANALTAIHNLVLDLAAFNGMEMENMTRGPGWRFLDLGRRVERSQRVVELVQAACQVACPVAAVFEPVLEIADNTMTYRRRHYDEPRLLEAIELLLLDESNPRSLKFQVRELRSHVCALPHAANTREVHEERMRVEILDRMLEDGPGMDLELLLPGPEAAPLVQWLERMSGEISAFSDDLTNRYFSHTVPRVS